MVSEKNIVEFEWDAGNSAKNWDRHRVSVKETEEAFFDGRKLFLTDIQHSYHEHRFIIIAKTESGRLLFIVYTLRKENIRVISARDANRKEERAYEKAAHTTAVYE